MGEYRVGMVLSDKAETTISDRVSVNTCLCAVILQGSNGFRKENSVKRSPFAISTHTPTGGSTDARKDELFDELVTLARAKALTSQ